MLVLSRKMDEALLLDGEISVRVLKISGSRVQLGVDAPSHVQIKRAELDFEEAAASPKEAQWVEGLCSPQPMDAIHSFASEVGN